MNPPSPAPVRILFVCMGNICRSPAAENIFRHLAARAGRAADFEIDSAGTLDYHAGSPPDPRMTATLTAAGYPSAGRARRVTLSDLERFDLILTMDEDNFAEVRALDRSGAHHPKIRPFVSYCTATRHPRVPDPYTGGQSGFDLVLRILEDAGAGLLAAIPPGSRP